MRTTRWQPWEQLRSEMNQLEQQVVRLLNGRERTRWPVFERRAYPLLNLWEDDENLYVEAELPGLKLEDLEIYVTGGNQLSIKGQRDEPKAENGTWHRQERGFGPFSRVVELPHEVDHDQVTAEFQNGVLTITLPKRAESKPRRIQIKSS